MNYSEIKLLLSLHTDKKIGIINSELGVRCYNLLKKASGSFSNLQLINIAKDFSSFDYIIIPYIVNQHDRIKRTFSKKSSKLIIWQLEGYPYNIINILNRKGDCGMSKSENKGFKTRINTIKMEDFARSGIQAINCVSIGLGQAGINITSDVLNIRMQDDDSSFYNAYNGICVASSEGDAKATERYEKGHKEDFIFLRGIEKGTGRDRTLSKSALPTLRELVRSMQAKKKAQGANAEGKEILTSDQSYNVGILYQMLKDKVDIQKTDMILVCAGLSGGTGSGLLKNTITTIRTWLDNIDMVDTLGNKRKIVLGALGILPLSSSDSKELMNTRDCMKEIIELADSKALDFFLPVDNNYMAQRYRELVDNKILQVPGLTFKTFINQIAVNWFHEINSIVTKSSTTAFDMKDLLTIYQSSRNDSDEFTYGVISLNKHVVKMEDIEVEGSRSNLYTILENVITNPSMTDKFDSKTLYQLGVIIVKNSKNTKVTEDILLETSEKLKKSFPNLDTLSGIKIGIMENESYVSEEEAIIYTISKFISYPERVAHLKDEIKESIEIAADAPIFMNIDLGEDTDFKVKKKQPKSISKEDQEEKIDLDILDEDDLGILDDIDLSSI